MRHGECVSIGMAYIAYLSHELGLISQELLSRHLEVLTRLGLPISYPCNQWPELLGAMRMDKKTRGDVLRFVALSDIGKTQRLENPQESALISAYEKVCL
jgi:3-dehydroquinate synthase